MTEAKLALLGCGKMGSALLAGWLERGIDPAFVTVTDPAPSDWLRGSGVRLGAPPEAAETLLVAVKPQMMDEALASVRHLGGGGTLVVSIAAGWPIRRFEAALGAGTPVVRAMPNTPAAIGRGITAIVGNEAAGEAGLDAAEGLLSAVGELVRLPDEELMDSVTGVSGSGPAYVFHLIETLAAAGEAEGLSADMALRLARATVAGAGALAMEAGEDPAQLRRNVTSPKGTTEAALKVLMDPDRGFPKLVPEAVAAAVRRSKELGS